jgi:hypothetical protein
MSEENILAWPLGDAIAKPRDLRKAEEYENRV